MPQAQFTVTLDDGTSWTDRAANHGAAAKAAIAEVYEEDVPAVLKLRVERHEGGAVVIRPATGATDSEA